MIFEEVDLKATRSYHVDEYELLDKYFGGYYSDFAINYDSAFLMVPALGASRKKPGGNRFLFKISNYIGCKEEFPHFHLLQQVP